MFTSESTMLPLFLQMLLAIILGAAIGFEREVQGKAAGLRTYALVSLGSCLFTIVSAYGFSGAGVDPSRIAAQIVTGIGFIGAGVIFLREDVVYGLTTAAGLWISAAIGVAIGAGLYEVAIFATVISLLILTLLKPLERLIRRNASDKEQHNST